MHEILESLPPGSLVLDLGSGAGSFAKPPEARVVRLDLEPPPGGSTEPFVQARAEELPFRDGSFAAVIANHSLEHIDDLPGALKEVGRVVRDRGAFFASVPDAGTFTDILYRWLARGGGHVNAFTQERQVVEMAERLTGLRFAGSRVLLSSLSFLNRRNAPAPRPRKLLLLGGGAEWTLRVYVFFSRLLDRLFGTRFSVYGWAFYFGAIPRPIDTQVWANVCVGCGSGCSREELVSSNRIQRSWIFLRSYECPVCGVRNILV